MEDLGPPAGRDLISFPYYHIDQLGAHRLCILGGNSRKSISNVVWNRKANQHSSWDSIKGPVTNEAWQGKPHF